jgi:hypothetical protein
MDSMAAARTAARPGRSNLRVCGLLSISRDRWQVDRMSEDLPFGSRAKWRFIAFLADALAC